jgi:hypothetical protein
MPERMIMPGYMKDVFAWQEDPIKTLQNKESAFLATGQAMVTGKDWKGDPISPPTQDPNAPFEQTVPPWLRAYLGLVTENVIPISVRELRKGQLQGTAISPAEQLMGLRAAGRRFTDPEGYKALKEYREMKDWRKKQKYDARQQNLYGGVE